MMKVERRSDRSYLEESEVRVLDTLIKMKSGPGTAGKTFLWNLVEEKT